MIIFPKIDIATIQGVLIDIDDTLYAYEPPHTISLSECYQLAKKYFNLSEIEFKTNYRKHRTNVTNRLIPQGACRSRFLAFQGLFEELKVSNAYEKALEMDFLYWDVFIQNMRVLDTAKQFLLACAKQEIPVCAVSDMTVTVQVQKLKKLGLTDLIDYLVTSEETGAEKPNPIMFTTALKKLGMIATEVIMIGDHLQKDIQAAECLGIKAYHVIKDKKS